MSFYFAKKTRKGHPKKLAALLSEYAVGQRTDLSKSILGLLESITETLTNPLYNRDDLPSLVNQRFYRSGSCEMLIKLLPSFDKPVLFAISTVIQTTIRDFPDDSLPKYLIENTELYDTLISFFEQKSVNNVAYTLFRACLVSLSFTSFIFKNGTAGSFIRFVADEEFEGIVDAMQAYDSILNIHPSISGEYFKNEWEIACFAFKHLLNTKKPLLLLAFLPHLYCFLTHVETRHVLRLFIEDIDLFKLSMEIMTTTKQKLQISSYNIFKLFILNPHKSDHIRDICKPHRDALMELVKDIKMPPDDPDLEGEKLVVIRELRKF